MNIITKKQESEKKFNKSVENFLSRNKIGTLLKQSNAYKRSGIPIIQVMEYLIKLVFSKKSMYMDMVTGTNTATFGRDVVYRFLNATFINWSTFLLKLAMSVISELNELTDEKRINAIVVDDTMYSRGSSKKVELLAKVFDHASKPVAFKKGFRLLTVTWSDGATLIPLLFRHLSSQDRKNRYVEMNESLDKRSVGYKVRQQAIQSAPTVLLDMLKQVVKAGVPSKHILFDSWFSFPKAILEISELKLFVVARLKNTPKIHYLFNKEKKTLKQIYALNKKRRGLSKYLLSINVEINGEKGESVAAKIVYVRNRNNRKDWIAIISTDLSLTEEEIIQLYGKRWDIEVFFKMCKSYLNMGKEFQGLSYDCITAHTAIVMTRYIMLATEKRRNEDMRTMGEIFFLCYDEVSDISFAQAIEFVFNLFRAALEECLFLSDEQILSIIDIFISKLPSHFSVLFDAERAS